MGAVSGQLSPVVLSCLDDVDLASKPIGSLLSGDLAFVLSKKGTSEGPVFFLDRDSALPVDGVGVLSTSAPEGRWLSLVLYNGSALVELVGDVLAGPAQGPVPSTVVGLQHNPVGAGLLGLADAGKFLVWNGASWVPLLAAPASLPVYGEFYSKTTQAISVNVNTPTIASNLIAGDASGITLGGPGNSHVIVPSDGVYEFTYSAQLQISGGAKTNIHIWLQKNGVPQPETTSVIELGNNNSKSIPFCSYQRKMLAGQYVEFAMWADADSPTLHYFAPIAAGPTNPAIPGDPAIIVTAKRLGDLVP